MPTASNPMTGFLQIVQENEIIRPGILVENAVKMVVSPGKLTPKEVSDKMPIASYLA